MFVVGGRGRVSSHFKFYSAKKTATIEEGDSDDELVEDRSRNNGNFAEHINVETITLTDLWFLNLNSMTWNKCNERMPVIDSLEYLGKKLSEKTDTLLMYQRSGKAFCYQVAASNYQNSCNIVSFAEISVLMPDAGHIVRTEAVHAMLPVQLSKPTANSNKTSDEQASAASGSSLAGFGIPSFSKFKQKLGLKRESGSHLNNDLDKASTSTSTMPPPTFRLVQLGIGGHQEGVDHQLPVDVGVLLDQVPAHDTAQSTSSDSSTSSCTMM
jgi:hypothetical protein